jgi:asparagine N-glycosylation enzyme membrane subunit Stt3
MEKASKFLPLILGAIVAIFVFFVSRKIRKGNETSIERASILEKAREAKLAKSILKKSDDEESTTNIES